MAGCLPRMFARPSPALPTTAQPVTATRCALPMWPGPALTTGIAASGWRMPHGNRLPCGPARRRSLARIHGRPPPHGADAVVMQEDAKPQHSPSRSPHIASPAPLACMCWPVGQTCRRVRSLQRAEQNWAHTTLPCWPSFTSMCPCIGRQCWACLPLATNFALLAPHQALPGALPIPMPCCWRPWPPIFAYAVASWHSARQY